MTQHPTSPFHHGSSRGRFPIVPALAAVIAVAIALQVAEALRHPVWFTEICVLRTVERPFGDMMRVVTNDIHPPLAFVLRWLLAVLGGGEGAQKALSIAFAAAALVPTFAIGRRLFGAKAGLLAAFLVAMPPVVVHFGQEVDDYSLQMLLILTLVHFAFAWFDEERPRDAVAYVVAAALACYSHYVSLVIVAVTAALGVAWLRADRRALGWWALMQLAVLALFAPQIGIALQQYAREGNGAWFHFPPFAVVLSLAHAIGFDSRPGALLVAVLAGVALARERSRPEAAAMVVLSTLPILATRVWVVVLPREVLFVVAFWMLLAAGGVSQLPRRWMRWSAAAALVALATFGGLRAHGLDEGDTTGRSLAWTKAHAATGALVVHAETHSLLFWLWHDPQFENRILVPAGGRVPFFEGGLVVPAQLYLTPEDWRRRRTREPAWGVWVNRATVVHGAMRRAGAANAALLRAAGGDSVWHEGAVTVWRILASPAR